MLTKCLAFALLGLTVAASEPEKRQVINVAGCPNTFQLTSNPCASGQGRVYYQVPGDSTKFVQCDVLGRAYVVQCPSGLYYNPATTSCEAQQIVATPAPTGPCTQQAVATGQIHFPVQGDNTKFYECTGIGQAQILQCPTGLIWDTSRVACVYKGSVITATITPPGTVQFSNPCTAQQLAANHHYFAHPDPTKFIECDDAGQAFVVACPSGLVWNQYYETCASAYANTVVG